MGMVVGLLPRRRSGGCAARKNEVGLKRYQLLRKSLEQLNITCRPASIDLDVVTLGPPELCEFFPKPRCPGLCFRIVLGKRHQDTDMADALGLLRAHSNPSTCAISVS